uniref:Uncharacterized protein n=1 Tax=Arundo donax TaxID=35708 RepID=A0A0A8Y6H5_ARUDO
MGLHYIPPLGKKCILYKWGSSILELTIFR